MYNTCNNNVISFETTQENIWAALPGRSISYEEVSVHQFWFDTTDLI